MGVTLPCWKATRSIGSYLPSLARSSAAISSFTIPIIAFITRSAFALSGSFSIASIVSGVICHVTPNLSVSQPHAIVLPPSVSFAQYSSISPASRTSP